TNWDGSRNSIHVVDLQTTADRALNPGTFRDEGFPTFSPDDTYLAFIVYAGPQQFVMVQPVDGSSPARQVGPMFDSQTELSWRFSPDGKSIMVSDKESRQTRLVDVETGGDGRSVEWMQTDTGGWQRQSF